MRTLTVSVALLLALPLANCGDDDDDGDLASARRALTCDNINADRVATAVRAINGDTIELSSGERVRLIGVDTPETTPEECHGVAARSYTASQVQGREIELDVCERQATDASGQTLAFVCLDGSQLNADLLDKGFADASFISPCDEQFIAFNALREDAEHNSRGIWGACGRNHRQLDPTPAPVRGNPAPSTGAPIAPGGAGSSGAGGSSGGGSGGRGGGIGRGGGAAGAGGTAGSGGAGGTGGAGGAVGVTPTIPGAPTPISTPTPIPAGTPIPTSTPNPLATPIPTSTPNPTPTP